MFNPSIYENSQPEGFALLEVVDEQAKHPRAFVPLQRTELRGTVMGPLADFSLRQIFCYARTQYEGVIEALYRFPLPGDAAVSAITVRFGTVEIAATLQERAAAEEAYRAAKMAGHQAALAKRETPDLFTLQLTGLQPGEAITIETHYVQLARTDLRLSVASQPPQWSLRIPLTTAPRYLRSDERDSRAAAGQPLALLRDPGHRFLLDVEFQGVAHVSSPTHELVTTPLTDDTADGAAATDGQPRVLRVQLAAGEVLPDRDCLLAWSPPQAMADATLNLLTYRDELANRLYFLAIVAPPAQHPPTTPAREVTLLVDHSGSMRGPKWAAADWAIERFLQDLQPKDSFALATFHYQTHWLIAALQSATPTAVEQAVQWLQSQQESGGTELGVALEEALALTKLPADAADALARHLLIVTDAAVSDAARILRLADAERARADRRRISLLCIDAAPNAFLANALAERGGGIARFLTSDPTQQDIVTALDELLLAWREPLLVNLRLTVNRPDLVMSGQQSRTIDSPAGRECVIDLGDLSPGHAQWVAGYLPLPATDTEATPITFTLSAGEDDQPHLATLVLAPDAHSGNSTAAIKALFGARRVNALEYLMNADLDLPALAEQLARLGYDPATIAELQSAQPSKVYAENRRRQQVAQLRTLLVQEALDYGLASAETAFVATRREEGKPVTATVAVANALPSGWADGFLTATRSSSLGRSRHKRAMPMASPAPAMDPRAGGQRAGQLRQVSASFMPQQDPSPQHRSTAATTAHAYELFSGTPDDHSLHASLVAGEIVLFDSATIADPLPATATFTGCTLHLVEQSAAAQLRQALAEHEVRLAIYIDDLVAPRATIHLRDLLRAARRPLNLRRQHGETVRLTLFDPTNLLHEQNVAFSLVLLA